MKIVKVVAVGIMLIAGVDLLTGNTNNPVLPAFLGNLLTQAVDAVLIGVGVLVLIFL